jgi:ABC-type sugar transport system ATPase subunit
MDEPISHLDAKLRSHMRGELKRLQREIQSTTVYVSHDQLEAMSMADRIAVLNSGEIQQFDTPDRIFHLFS